MDTVERAIDSGDLDSPVGEHLLSSLVSYLEGVLNARGEVERNDGYCAEMLFTARNRDPLRVILEVEDTKVIVEARSVVMDDETSLWQEGAETWEELTDLLEQLEG